MNDILLFFIGSFVTLVISGAVGMLMWVAANEPPRTPDPKRFDFFDAEFPSSSSSSRPLGKAAKMRFARSRGAFPPGR